MPLYAPNAAMLLVATTGPNGYALVNGTGTILTWTTPNDGLLHRFQIFASLRVTSGETGGAITVNITDPGGTTASPAIIAAAQTTGLKAAQANTYTVEANTAVALVQSSALTGGAAVLWAEIWGA